MHRSKWEELRRFVQVVRLPIVQAETLEKNFKFLGVAEDEN